MVAWKMVDKVVSGKKVESDSCGPGFVAYNRDEMKPKLSLQVEFRRTIKGPVLAELENESIFHLYYPAGKSFTK